MYGMISIDTETEEFRKNLPEFLTVSAVRYAELLKKEKDLQKAQETILDLQEDVDYYREEASNGY